MTNIIWAILKTVAAIFLNDKKWPYWNTVDGLHPKRA